jgi:hypothetical protein
MIHYHGLPITPESAAARVAIGGHVFLSYAHRGQQAVATTMAQSFAVDNGAFSAWREGSPITDWSPFWEWAGEMVRVPSCDFVVVPDVIDGGEAENDELIWEAQLYLPEWSLAPVYHLHERIGRLEELARDFDRICIGSSGEYESVGSRQWWGRMCEVMDVLCDDSGRPTVKIHGLRMLNPAVFSLVPFASADSTNIGRNIGLDSAWRGTYQPATKETRAQVMRERIESVNAPAAWDRSAIYGASQAGLFSALPGIGEYAK